MEKNSYTEMANLEAHHWWFVARRRILSNLIAKIPLSKQANILEIGAGTGGNWNWLNTFGHVTALEMDPYARELFHTKTGHHATPGTLPDNMPALPPQELICLFGVLEHIEDDSRALQTLLPLLTDEGRIVLTVPAHPYLMSSHDLSLHHFRRYTRPQLIKILEDTPLKIVRLTYFNTLLYPAVVLGRLADRLKLARNPIGRQIPAPLINNALKFIFELESKCLPVIDLPWGVSLYAECIKR